MPNETQGHILCKLINVNLIHYIRIRLKHAYYQNIKKIFLPQRSERAQRRYAQRIYYFFSVSSVLSVLSVVNFSLFSRDPMLGRAISDIGVHLAKSQGEGWRLGGKKGGQCGCERSRGHLPVGRLRKKSY